MRRAQSTSHPSSNNPFADPQGQRTRPASMAAHGQRPRAQQPILETADAPYAPPPYSPIAPPAASFPAAAAAARPPSASYGSPPQSYAPASSSRPSSTGYASPPMPPPQSPPPAAAARVQRRTSIEDPLAGLGRFDVSFLIDDSPSMDPLWDEAKECLMGVVDKSVKYDKDGIDCHFMNAEASLQGCTQPQEIARLFSSVWPSGSTPTGMRLDDMLRPYIERCEDAKAAKTALPKPMVLVVLTDGRADDEYMVKDVIVEMAQRLDDARLPPFQLGIQFLQIGNDPDAAAFLAQLDDDIKAEANVRDIVDTRQYEGRLDGEALLRILLGSVNRRVDAMPSS